MAIKEPKLWQNRWQALDRAILEFQSISEASGETTITNVLKCLRDFGQRQFCFFFNGFSEAQDNQFTCSQGADGTRINYLTQSPRYKAEFALRRTIDQMAYDLSLLQRAFSQRRPESSTVRERATLVLADRLAYTALQPAVNAGYLGETAVITYFQKSSFVRVIPYAPVAMVGIPHTCTGIFEQGTSPELLADENTAADNVRDFLAIPHEIGHYLYWHAQKGNLRARISSELREGDGWRNRWLEEIFADVYGIRVAGPVLALDFQEVLGDNLDVTEDDGEHPVTMARPYLLTYALRKLQYDNTFLFTQAPDILDELWTNFLRAERGNPTSFIPQAGDGTAVTLYQVRKKGEEAIDKILELISSMLPSNTAALWSQDADAPGIEWYKSFKSSILASLPQENLPPIFDLQNQPLQNWQVGQSLFPWFSILRSAVESHALVLTPETWSVLLEAGGWAAGGPENSGNPPTGG